MQLARQTSARSTTNMRAAATTQQLSSCRPAAASCRLSSVQLHAAAPAQTARRSLVRRSAVEQDQQENSKTDGAADSTINLDKQLSKLTRQTASTFAPRASGKAKPNPAYKGSTLYNIFEVQAWLAVAAGGLLSFNVIFPTDEPSIPRLMGMWSIWMFTIPSLRAKECMPREKDALNLLFLLVPLMNVILPFVWKSFPFIFTADVAAMVGVYAWKGVWSEVYGLPLGTAVAAAAGGSSSSSADAGSDQQQQ